MGKRREELDVLIVLLSLASLPYSEFPTAVISASAEVDNMNETVTIQWTYIQEDAVPLTGFSLRGRLFASTTPTIDITVGPEVRQHVLSLSEDMLEPDANYVITVRAVNLLGEGDARDVPFISREYLIVMKASQ